MNSYRYFVKKGSWEISIAINAEIKEFDQASPKGEEVYEGLWVSFAKKSKCSGQCLSNRERSYLVDAVKFDGKIIVENSIYMKQTWIEIDSVQFSDCYYQEDALFIAMRFWISSAFGVKEPPVRVDFDEQNNRYLFYNNEYGL